MEKYFVRSVGTLPFLSDYMEPTLNVNVYRSAADLSIFRPLVEWALKDHGAAKTIAWFCRHARLPWIRGFPRFLKYLRLFL